jgi:uncharacterized protein (DUF4415 family)
MVIQTAKLAPKPVVKVRQIAKPKATISLPPEKVAKPAPKKRGRQPSGQVIVTMRMDPEVRDILQADGPGWGARANSLLRKALGL